MARKKKTQQTQQTRVRFTRAALTEYVPFRVTPSQREALRAEADRLGCSESDVVRAALDVYFERRSR